MAKTKNEEPKGEDGRLDGLTEVETLGVKSVSPRGKDALAVTFLGPVPEPIVNDQPGHRFVIEGEEQVRSFHGVITGDVLVVEAEIVPATFEALKGAAGKNLRFYRLG
jgi:hypothetical protein